MTHYFKRHWNETTGEELTDNWGTSTYYFETDEQFNVIRQMQVFEKGQVLKYHSGFMGDEFGMLSDRPLDKEDFNGFAIDKAEFTINWDNLAGKTK